MTNWEKWRFAASLLGSTVAVVFAMKNFETAKRLERDLGYAVFEITCDKAEILASTFKNYQKTLGIANQDADSLGSDFQNLGSAIQSGKPIATLLAAQKVDLDRKALWTDIAILSQAGKETCSMFSDPHKTYVLSMSISQMIIAVTCFETPFRIDEFKEDYFLTSPESKLVL